MTFEWLHAQMDYVYLVYGLAFFLLAKACYTVAGLQLCSRIPWKWLGLFGLSHGLYEWLEMIAMAFPVSQQFYLFRIAVMAVSYRVLLEFGLRGYSAQTGRYPGNFLPNLLTAVGGIGALWGINGLAITFRYFLGIPGTALTAYAFYIESSEMPEKPRIALRGISFTMGIYCLLAGVVVQPGDIWPAYSLNTAWWLEISGIPIEILRTLVVFFMVSSVSFLGRHFNENAGEKIWYRRLFVSFVSIFIIVAGWFAVQWRGNTADEDFRAQILREAVNIAGTVNPQRVKELNFTGADVYNDAFLRLQSQMKAFGKNVAGLRGIYTLALRNSAMLFGPENYTENDPSASPPGTVYERPDPRIRAVFETGQAITIGPFTDEYGTFVSAFAPVKDSRNGEVLMLVGIDVLAEDWLMLVAKARAGANFVVIMLLSVFLFGITLIQIRASLNLNSYKWYILHSETIFVGALGLIGTFVFVMLISEVGHRKNLQEFIMVADSRNRLVRETFGQVRRDLESVARFMGTSGQARTMKDFAGFVEPIDRSSFIQAWEWVPIVNDHEKAEFESRMSLELARKFEIFRIDEEGARIPATGKARYFPVTYVYPEERNPGVAGFDLGSEEKRAEAVSRAWQSMCSSVVNSIDLVQFQSREPGMLVFLPVIDKKNKDVIGFVLAVLRLGGFLEAILPGESYMMEKVEFLTLSDAEPFSKVLVETRKEKDEYRAVYSAIYPIFIFGKSFGLRISSGSDFLASRRVFEGPVVAGATGLLLTLVLTAFTGFLKVRQFTLETQVNLRARELVERENDLYITLNSIGDAVIASDIAGRITRMNPAAVKLTGWSFAEAFGMSVSKVFRIINQRNRLPVACPIEDVLNTGQTIELANDTTLISRNGEEFQIADSAAPIRDANGIIRGAVLVFHDITEQYRIREELRESEAKLKNLIASIPGITYRCRNDFSWNMIFISDEIERLTGFSPDEFINNRIRSYMSIIHPGDVGRVSSEITKSLTESRFFEIEYRIRKNDESYLWVFERGRGIYDESGNLMFLEGVIIDINGRKAAEEELQNSEERLRAITESAHDAILMMDRGGIISYCNSAAEEMFGYEKVEFIGKNLHELLAPERYQSRIADALGKFNLSNIRDSAGKTLELEALRKDGSEIAISLSLSVIKIKDELVAVGMIRDVTEQKKAAQELMQSREQYMLAVAGSKDGIWDWNLRDNSLFLSPNWKKMIGYDDPEIANEYSSFEKLIHPDDRARVVSYIQSYIKGLIKDYSIEFRFKHKNGNYIWILARGEALRDENGIPYRMAGSHMDITERKLAEGHLKEVLAAPLPVVCPEFAGNNNRMLLVEDNLTNQEVVIVILSRLGYKIDLAENGRRALDMLKDGDYRLVIMDCQMPEMDGFEATRIIRSGKIKEINPDIPIIAMTANAMQGDRERCIAAGMDDYLAKPVKPQALIEKISSWLNGKSTETKITQPTDADDASMYSEPENTDSIIFAEEEFLERMLSEINLVRKVIGTFLRDVPSQLEGLKGAVNNGDREEGIRLAHNIKGSAANISAHALKKAAFDLEKNLKADDGELNAALEAVFLQFETLKTKLSERGYI